MIADAFKTPDHKRRWYGKGAPFNLCDHIRGGPYIHQPDLSRGQPSITHLQFKPRDGADQGQKQALDYI